MSSAFGKLFEWTPWSFDCLVFLSVSARKTDIFWSLLFELVVTIQMQGKCSKQTEVVNLVLFQSSDESKTIYLLACHQGFSYQENFTANGYFWVMKQKRSLLWVCKISLSVLSLSCAMKNNVQFLHLLFHVKLIILVGYTFGSLQKGFGFVWIN